MADLEDYQYLKELISKGECIPFLGAKISELAGCKSYRDILADFATVPYLTQPIADMQQQSLLPRDIISFAKAEILKKEKSLHLFESKFIQATQTQHEDLMNKFKPFVTRLLSLNPNLKLLTTNFDSSLTDCRLFIPESIYWNTSDFTHSNFEKSAPAVFHLHNSTYGGVQNVVMETENYTERYSDPQFNAFLYSVFQNHPVLFLGYGLGDQEIRNILKGLKDYGATSIKKHFAVLSEEFIKESNLTEREYRDLYNIQIINYGPRSTFESAITSWFSSPPTVSTGEDVGRPNK